MSPTFRRPSNEDEMRQLHGPRLPPCTTPRDAAIVALAIGERDAMEQELVQAEKTLHMLATQPSPSQRQVKLSQGVVEEARAKHRVAVAKYNDLLDRIRRRGRPLGHLKVDCSLECNCPTRSPPMQGELI